MKDDAADTDEPEKEGGETDEGEPAPSETQPADDADEAPVAPPASEERPLFAQAWPASSELDRLLVAFERGNYAFVREEAPKVAARASDPAIKAAALDLRKRIDPAPLAGILVIVAIGLLVVLAGHYLGKHNPGAPPSVAPAPTNAPLQPPAPNR